ncbi:hypothetical protein [Haliangium sp.]|uniref:hypothetical protein n=1 Tax=Haliangium sp. TaxID=2663208 RepID=UPI003D0C4333
MGRVISGVLFGIGMIGLVACATPKPAPQSGKSETTAAEVVSKRIVCKEKLVAGSHIPRKVCWEERGSAIQRDHVNNQLLHMQNQNWVQDPDTVPSGPRVD